MDKVQGTEEEEVQRGKVSLIPEGVESLNGKGKIDEALPGEGGEAILEKTLLPGG